MRERRELAKYIRSKCNDLFRLKPELLAPYDGDKDLFAASTESEGHYNGESILLVTAHKYGRNISCYVTNGTSDIALITAAPSVPSKLLEIKLAVISSYHWMWMKPKNQICLFEMCPIPADPSEETARAERA